MRDRLGRKKPSLWLAGFFVLLTAGGTWWWGTRTYHLLSVQDGVLYRCGNRNIAEFAHGVRQAKVRTVISLIDDREVHDPQKPQFKGEQTFLSNVGVKQERIPVQLGGWPANSDIQKFLAIVSDPTNRPVLVHCAQGVRRTGMFVAAYQESVLGYDKQKARDSIQTFGHSDRVADDIRKFIDNYDPTAKTVNMTEQPTSNE